jgi:hypothetical protein
VLGFSNPHASVVGNYQAQIIGHGTEEDGVRKLNKKTGKIIAEELKQLTSIIHFFLLLGTRIP